MSEQPQGPTLADAYAEATQALGEEIVQRRLLAKQANAAVVDLTAQVERLTAERDDLLHRADHAPQD